MNTPIIYLIFNRPDLTEITFEAVRRARPSRLLVVADGPRADRPGERDLCAAARAVTEQLDWPCDVVREYAEANMGCGRRVSSGITRGFELFEEAIVLEDDCLPDPSFFPYCAELLERYRGDQRVMAISGDNFQPGPRTQFSYYFSRYAHCWGWATWRRAWARYDFHVADWDPFSRSTAFRKLFPHSDERAYWRGLLASLAAGKIDTWDHQWAYACWRHGGLVALPEANLVANLGFRPDATHTRGEGSLARLPTTSVGELRHPPEVAVHDEADRHTFKTVFQGPLSATPRAKAERAARRVARWLLRR